MIRQLLYPSRFEPINAPANPAAPLQWFAPFSEPRKIVTAAAVLIASGCTLPPQAPVVAVTVPQGWYSPLSLPVTATKRFQPTYGLHAQPPQADYVPVHGWFSPLSLPVKAAKQYQPEYRLPAQPPIVVPTQVYLFPALNQPVFAPKTFTRQLYPFHFAPPAAPPVAPAMAFFAPLSQPVFAQVKYPDTRFHFPSWSFPEPAPPPVPVGPPYNPGFIDGGRILSPVRGGREMEPTRGGRSISPTNGGRSFRPNRT